jgi:hypothetical protein
LALRIERAASTLSFHRGRSAAIALILTSRAARVWGTSFVMVGMAHKMYSLEINGSVYYYVCDNVD